MSKVEEIMELAASYAECRIGVYSNPTRSSDGDKLDKSVVALKAAIEELDKDDFFKNACRIHTSFLIGRYLIYNSFGRWNGAEKAQCHIQLCQFYVAALRGLDDVEKVSLASDDFKSVHRETQKLTDRLDEVIEFQLESTPDYDKLEPLFFEHFHNLAVQAMQSNLIKSKVKQ